MPGGAVAMAEGNALGKGPVIFHLFDSGIEYIRNKAAGNRWVWILCCMLLACAVQTKIDTFDSKSQALVGQVSDLCDSVSACLLVKLVEFIEPQEYRAQDSSRHVLILTLPSSA